MKRIYRKMLATVLSAAVLLLYCPPVAALAANEQTVKVGAGESHQTLRSVFDDAGISGNVVVQLTSTVKEAPNDASGVLAVPDRMTKLTIAAAEEQEIEIYGQGGTQEKTALFLNGKGFVLAENVKLNGSVFGGGYQKAVTGSPKIDINGCVVNGVYGGGFQGDLTGDPMITINGTAGYVSGGGYAYAFRFSSSACLSARATVTGAIRILIGENGTVQGRVSGGGKAESHNKTSDGERFSATADCKGDIAIEVNGTVGEVCGGGYAGDGTSATDVRNSAMQSDVFGNIDIRFGPNSKAPDSSSMNKMVLYGGGQAYARADSKAQANVVGNVAITAIEDANAASGQPDIRSFSRMFGGGRACGEQATASVQGNTSIHTARVCWESNMGIVGGGSALYGGTANVEGESGITLEGIQGQTASYENANGVIGGGFAGWGSDPNTTKPSTANVGKTKIVVREGTQFAYGAGNNGTIIGGGYAYGYNAAINSGKPEYNQCPAIAQVLGDTEIIIEKNINTLGGQFVTGGGFVYCRGNADVKGTARVQVGDGCALGYLLGGGRVDGKSTDEVKNAIISADVGAVSMQLGDSITMGQYFCGGGYVQDYTENGSAQVRGDIDYTIGNNFTGTWLFGGGLFPRGSSARSGGVVDVWGRIRASIGENCTLSGQFVGGCGLGIYDSTAERGSGQIGKNRSVDDIAIQTEIAKGFSTLCFTAASRNYKVNDGNLTVHGSVSTTIHGSGQPKEIPSFVGGSRNYSSTGNATVAGGISSYLENCRIGTEFFDGGFVSGSGGNADVAGLVDTTVRDTTLAGKLQVGGNANQSIGKAKINLLGDVTLVNLSKAGTTKNGTELNIGDGEIETNVHCGYVYGENVKIVMEPKSALHHINDNPDTPDNSNQLFFNVLSLWLKEGAQVELTKSDVLGSLTGGGSVILPAGRCLTINGLATGTTTVKVIGDIAAEQTYITAAAGSSGEFLLDSPDWMLKKTQENGKTVWKTVESVLLTAVAGEHGTVSPAGTFAVEKGTDQTFAITPDPGYRIERVMLDGIDVTMDISNLRYTVTADSAKTLSVAFTRDIRYATVTASAGDHGKIVPSGVIQLEQGTEKTFSFQPDSGYKVAHVLVNGEDVTEYVADNTYTITADTDTSIAVSFDETIHKVTVTAENGQNGTVEPCGKIEVERGTARSFKFHPDPGYKVASATLDKNDVTRYLKNNVYTFAPDTDCVLAVSFEPMQAPDLDNGIDGLPDLPAEAVPDEEQQNSILDTKLDYEALKENGEADISDESVAKLNDALAKLPGVEVKTESDPKVCLPDPNMTLQNMTQEEALQIKQHEIEAYHIILQVKPAETIPETKQAALQQHAERAGVTIGPAHDVTLKKQITKASTGEKTEEPLTELQRQITLVFDVSEQSVPEGVERRWSVLLVHGEGTGITTELLYDQDNDDKTVTVRSNRFSLYALAYQDVSAKHGGGTVYHTITASAGQNGSVKPNGRIRVAHGNQQTFSITPDSGYEIDDVLVDGKRIGAVRTYTFKQVTTGHTFEVSFRPILDKHDWPFVDVAPADWFYDSVQYAYVNELMCGTSNTTFSPQEGMTRGMAATILWRMAGKPAVQSTSFTDILSSAYYANAVAWAAERGVIKGYDEFSFGPGDLVTREQLAAMLYRYADKPPVEQSEQVLTGYRDRNQIAPYAVEPLAWAVEQGMIGGKGDNLLDPKGYASRAETATILMRYLKANGKVA